MLKTKQDDEWWLITQPAHAELAGQMAAHWGNDTFASPGHFATSTHPDRLKQEVLLAIAEHDNGWWEWEADPVLSPDNALPQGLAEVVANPEHGMERWRKGIPRLPANHPYASLLISDHASWLYTAQFDPQHSQEFTHPLQAQRSLYPPDQRKRAEGFVSEMRATQATLTQRLKQDSFWRSALDAKHRWPPARLLQILDALSLGCVQHAHASGRSRTWPRARPVPVSSRPTPHLGIPRSTQDNPRRPRVHCAHPLPLRRGPLDGDRACQSRSGGCRLETSSLDASVVYVLASVIRHAQVTGCPQTPGRESDTASTGSG